MKKYLLFLLTLTSLQMAQAQAQYGINPPKAPGMPGRIGIGEFEQKQSVERKVEEIFTLAGITKYLYAHGENAQFVKEFKANLVKAHRADPENAQVINSLHIDLLDMRQTKTKLTKDQRVAIVEVLTMITFTLIDE